MYQNGKQKQKKSNLIEVNKGNFVVYLLYTCNVYTTQLEINFRLASE